jgi:hypothetical protein
MSVAFLQHFGGSACPLTDVVPVITCEQTSFFIPDASHTLTVL